MVFEGRRSLLDNTKRSDKMAKDEKQLCKWNSQDVATNFDKFTDMVKNPKFLCKKCGWAASKKKWLHKPVAIK